MPYSEGVERQPIANINGDITGEPRLTISNYHATSNHYARYRIAEEIIPIKVQLYIRPEICLPLLPLS
jgi:hypothetical protein